MACQGCIQTVTTAITAPDPGATVQANLKDRTIMVETTRSAGEVERSLAEVGYPARPL
jgi:copper chaperone CopZ